MNALSKDTANKHKSRLSFFGPGTVIALTAAALYAWPQLSAPPKVHIERQLVPSAGVVTTRKPSAEQLLAWGTALQLTELQKEKLLCIAQEERIALTPVNAYIDGKIKIFNSFAAKHEKASLCEIENLGRPLSDLSKRKRQIQNSFAEQGLELLSAQQKKQALQLQQSLFDGFQIKHRRASIL